MSISLSFSGFHSNLPLSDFARRGYQSGVAIDLALMGDLRALYGGLKTPKGLYKLLKGIIWGT